MDTSHFDQRRIVLFPSGQPKRYDDNEDEFDTAMRAIYTLRGDPERLISPSGLHTNGDLLEALLDMLNRNRRSFAEELPHSLVFFTEAYPPSLKLINIRRMLQDRFSELETALWAVMVDEQNPFFFESMGRLGRFEDLDSCAPIFTDGMKQLYLLLRPVSEKEMRPALAFIRKQEQRIMHAIAEAPSQYRMVSQYPPSRRR